MKGVSHFFVILGIIFVILAIIFKLVGYSQVKPITDLHLSPDAFHQFGQTLLLLGICFNFWKPKAIEPGEKKEGKEGSE